MPSFVNAGGTYKRIFNAWIKVSGEWKLLDTVHVRQDGWRLVHQATRVFVFNRTLSGTTYNYNLRNDILAAGWDGVAPVVATVTIPNGSFVGSTSVTNYAFNTGTTYPDGSSITVINYGIIAGRGGKGGDGANGWTPGYSYTGGPGGPAFFAGRTCTLINYGVLAGAGGGGGGGQAYPNDYYSSIEAGAGGGGGQGLLGGTGGLYGNGVVGPNGGGGDAEATSGSDGSVFGPGRGGDIGDNVNYSGMYQSGGNGGAFGNSGGQSLKPYFVSGAPNPGGPPGAAIVGIANVTLTNTGNIYGVQI